MARNRPRKRWGLPSLVSVLLLGLLQSALGQETHTFSSFHFTVEPSNIIAYKGYPALLNCSAENSGNTPRTQWIRDGVYMSLNGDSRRYKLNNGSLYFSSIEHTRSSRPDEGVYKCVATVMGLGTLVSRAAKLQVGYFNRDFKEEPKNVNVHLGDNAVFTCAVDSIPRASIVWFKGSTELSDSPGGTLRIYPDGILEIQDVKFSDLGQYHCKSEYSEPGRSRPQVSTSAVASLTQNADTSTYKGVSPRFIITPTDTTVLEGSTVHLYCGANGRDSQENTPQIMWLKSGTTIDTTKPENARFSVVGLGSLRIESVTEADAGLYTCRAENNEDSIDATATLVVQVAPRFVKEPESFYAHVNADVQFDCEIYGNPTPKITWMKNGDIVIPSDYFQIIDGKHLRILGLVISDDGLYQCFGENAVGNVQASAQLVVLQPGSDQPVAQGQPPSAPRELKAVMVGIRFITLKWKEPQETGEGPIYYAVYWKAQGSDRERVMNTTSTDANVQLLKPATRYTFRVLAANSHGSGDAQTLQLTTQPEVHVPTQVRDLTAMALSTRELQITWSPPNKTNGNIREYKIHYYKAMDTHEMAVVVPGSTTSYTLANLRPYTECFFRVVAFNQNGPGMSTDEVSARTFSAAPSGPPQNVTVEPSTSNSILIQWEPPYSDERNGLITGYKIKYRQRGQSGKAHTIMTDGDRRLYSVTGLARDTTYSIRVAAVNTNGTGPHTPWTSVKTYESDLDESREPGIPSSLTVRPFTDRMVVHWTPPVQDNVMIRGYRIGYGVGVPDVYQVDVSANERLYTIKNLRPSSEYVVSLRAFNHKGVGRERLQTGTTRDESSAENTTPMIPPVGVKVTIISSSSVMVTWTDTTLGGNQRTSDHRYYTIKYIPATGSNRREKYVNSTELNKKIEDLKPATMYEFAVKVINARRQSHWSLTVVNTTKEAAPATAPRDLTPVPLPVSKKGPTCNIMLNWQPPKIPNGKITGYLVFYTTDATQKDRDWVVEGVLGEKLSITIKGLTPHTTYYFKVQARNSKGYGPMSSTVIYRTPRADGTGGGPIDTPEYDPNTPGGKLGHPGIDGHDMVNVIIDGAKEIANNEEEAEKNKGGISQNAMWIIIASCVCGVIIVTVIAIVVIVCRRKSPGERRRSGYHPSSKSKGPGPKDLKPPDLWIHHDLELKSMDKNSDHETSMTMTPIPRSSQEKLDDDQNQFETTVNEERYRRMPRHRPIMIPVDSQPAPPREPIATATALPNGHVHTPSDRDVPTRPVYPRTQYNMTPRVYAGDVSQPGSDIEEMQPLMGGTLDRRKMSSMQSLQRDQQGGSAYTRPQSPDSSYNQPPVPYDQLHLHSTTTPTAAESSNSLPQRTPNPLKSFSVPGPPRHQGAPGSPPAPKQLVVKPQQPTSPYKKQPTVTVSAMKSRTPMPVVTPKAPDLLKTSGDQKICSTEELSQEMANLEGLMKDLNAITQQEFEC
ncbi:neogenin isoform X2 [Lingula anatina]|uniref:Neogenin isoform X2 n=1 Tax=Lingula anatina TaxID=7574 RepID=A0A1S3HPH3_LINAN|nr:neogenin isoform X2 [Lingula anatina]|eukprot:XP_013387953.1 neogenin isoform X2 [Lingula anatina]